jgi:Arc/MetJ family transcription regulator
MQKYVPLSQRSPTEILTQADLYQEMATAARTPEARHSLEALVVRLVALADRLATVENRSRRLAHAMEVSSTAS